MEKLKFFIANTHINCKGESNVTFLCSEKNSNGTYYTSDYKNEKIILFEEEKEAIDFCENQPQWSVHGTWTK